MGITKAFKNSISSTFADQWKEIVTVDTFNERQVVAPGILKTSIKGRGSNNGTPGIISRKSIIYVPENTAAFIFNQSGIEDMITTPGGYEYQAGEPSIFSGDGIWKSLVENVAGRIAFGGIPSGETRIAYINLREIRGIKFGTAGPQLYHDKFYGVDLEAYAHGSYSVKVTDPVSFVLKYLPAGQMYYSFDDFKAKDQLNTEVVQSFSVVMNSLSEKYRISELHSQEKLIAQSIIEDKEYVGSWEERFGLCIIQLAIENIELAEESRDLIRKYADHKMSVSAFEDVSQKASDISAQQKIADGIKEHGLGDGPGAMIWGMNLAQTIGANAGNKTNMGIDEQIEAVKKLKELLDAGALTSEEFEKKKKEIMGL